MSNNVTPFPNQQYQIIYADPPWSYRDKALAGNRGAECKYAVQSPEWLKALPVADLAAPNCALFCWVTMPKLDEIWDIFDSWGFVYKTCAFTWVKRCRVSDAWNWGMGRWTRANAELCLLAIKGHPKRISAAVHSVVDTHIEGHSKKPDVVRNRIIELLGNLPRIELFARQRAQGWDAWGDELPQEVIL
jgi:N6-adenosine-specific RNA methylase IME4